MLIDHVIGGRYRITELIGQGGMGTVFEAVHTGTGSRVAIKLIVSNDIKEEVFIRFQREARAAGAIDSQHIVKVFDMGTDERSGSPYMAMERLFGEDLSQLTRRVGAVSPEIACALVAQGALGLAKAHESGVVHRDIKPANLFMHDGGDSGEVILKILDFGIAKVLMDAMQRSEEGGLTRTGSMLGSPHYMSPEQAQGLRTIDHRSDIWSLGVVFYKLLAGQTPHAHVSTLGQVILAICSQPVRPITDIAPWVSHEVATVVHRALQQDPNRRYQSAYEMHAALQTAMPNMPKVRRADIAPLSHSQRMPISAPGSFRPDIPTNGTQNGVAQSTRDPAPPAKSSGVVVAMIALGTMAAIGAAGIGLSVMAKKSAAKATAAAATSMAPVEPPVTTTASASSSPASPASAPAERTVTLAVSPANAIVQVDGTKRDVVNGVVELKGVLGGVVKVHVKANNTETTQSIAITEGGAIPPKITVGGTTAAAAAIPAAPPPPRAGGAKAGTAAPGKPAGTTLNAQRTFE